MLLVPRVLTLVVRVLLYGHNGLFDEWRHVNHPMPVCMWLGRTHADYQIGSSVTRWDHSVQSTTLVMRERDIHIKQRSVPVPRIQGPVVCWKVRMSGGYHMEEAASDDRTHFQCQTHQVGRHGGKPEVRAFPPLKPP